LKSVQFGEVQCHRNIVILPMLADDGTFQYRTLGEGLASGDVSITEVSKAGSVPELMATNRGKLPVLLLDGEELVGAKQNRVLNTSILLRELSETRVPVSCTERGRWSYVSNSFAESGNVMAHKVRVSKLMSVSDSLQELGSPRSDQVHVWHDIALLHHMAGCDSTTSAIDDVFRARQSDLQRALESFRCVQRQVGLFVFVESDPVGFDLLSLSSAYSKVHPKLVRSYAIESLIRQRPTAPTPPAHDVVGLAASFLGEILTTKEDQFPSVGYGVDCRYQANSLAGSALVHANEVIHAAFFRVDAGRESPAGGMVSPRIRCQYRRHGQS